MAEARVSLHQHVEALPVLPHVVARVMNLDPEASDFFDDVVRVIETEPNYAVRLIAAANSVVVRGVAPITRIREAVVRLGTYGVSSLIISMSVVRVFVPRTDWERGLWIHALEVGSVARALARHGAKGLDCERAYLSGLLHDVGRFILFSAAPELLREVDEAAWATPATLLEAEREVCGVDHATLGAEVCTRWGLPAHLVEFVSHHHALDVEIRLGGCDGHIARLVQVADLAGFSSVSSTHTLPRFRDMNPKEAETFVREALPPWYAQPNEVVPVVSEALCQADKMAESIGLRLVKKRGRLLS